MLKALRIMKSSKEEEEEVVVELVLVIKSRALILLIAYMILGVLPMNLPKYLVFHRLLKM